jgi:hypothetical protein
MMSTMEENISSLFSCRSAVLSKIELSRSAVKVLSSATFAITQIGDFLSKRSTTSRRIIVSPS